MHESGKRNMESWTNPVRDACYGPAVTRKQMAEVLVGIVGIAIAGFILFRVVQAVAVTITEAEGSDTFRGDDE
jgi:hypothetical protein